MNMRLSIIFYYKDGTKYHLMGSVPSEVAEAIHVKGLIQTEVNIEEKLHIQGLGGLNFNDFKKV